MFRTETILSMGDFNDFVSRVMEKKTLVYPCRNSHCPFVQYTANCHFINCCSALAGKLGFRSFLGYASFILRNYFPAVGSLDRKDRKAKIKVLSLINVFGQQGTKLRVICAGVYFQVSDNQVRFLIESVVDVL